MFVEAPALRVYRAEPHEARRLTEIAFAAKRHWGYSEDLIRLWWDELVITPEYVREGTVLAAAEGERLVGCAAVGYNDGDWWLDHMWVLPERIGAGVGRALLERALETLRARDAVRLVVVSDPHAAEFYARLGGVEVGEWPSVPRGRVLPMYAFDVAR